MYLKSNQQKDQGVHEEGDIGPKRLQGGFSLRTAICCTQIADNEARRCGRNDPRQVQLIGEELTAVGNDGSESDLYFSVIDRSGEPARCIAEEGAKDCSSEYREEKLAHSLRNAQVS